MVHTGFCLWVRVEPNSVLTLILGSRSAIRVEDVLDFSRQVTKTGDVASLRCLFAFLECQNAKWGCLANYHQFNQTQFCLNNDLGPPL